MRNTNKGWVRALALTLAMVLTGFGPVVQAAMVETHSVISDGQVSYEKADLMQALQSDELRSELLAKGADPELIEQRLANLTADEIQQLNATLEQAPAGAGVGSVLLTLFLVFVVTDMLCATNVFKFVNCINR